MIKTDFTYQGLDNNLIHATKWVPEQDVPPKGLIQIIHGMGDHRKRYEHFAQVLTSSGYICFAEDHRGHGETLKDPMETGFFAEKEGWIKVFREITMATDIMTREYPNLPLIIFGHSLGSLLARMYMIRKPDGINGVILAGTSADLGLLGKIGRIIAAGTILIKGPGTPSPMLNSLSFGNFNKSFRPNRTDFDWISRDQESVDNYIADPLTGFVCSCSFYRDAIDIVDFVSNQANMNTIPPQIPVLMLSGDNDPVGAMGKGVTKVYNSLLKAGLNNMELKLYPGARHELINETNKEEAFSDILEWLNGQGKNRRHPGDMEKEFSHSLE